MPASNGNRGQPVADDPPGLEFPVERSVQYDLRATVRRSGYSIIDNFEDAFRNGYSVNTSAIYRVRLGKPGRTLTVDGFFNYFDSQNKQNSHTNDFGIYEDYPDLIPIRTRTI